MLPDLLSSLPEEQSRLGFEKLARLVELSLALNSTLELEELLQTILTTAAELLECKDMSILLYDERRKELRFAAVTGPHGAELKKMPVPLKNSLAGTIFLDNEPLVINRVEDDPRHYTRVGEELQYQVDSLLGVPMRIKDRVTGVIEAINKHEGDFTDFDVHLLSVIASQAAVALHNARLIHALRKANKELSRADELKKDFMSIASHELRTPLGVIMGYASFLHEDTSGETKQLAENVVKAAMRLRGVLDAMANMNLLYAGKTDLDIKPTTLRKILSRTRQEILPAAEAKGQQVHFLLPDHEIELEVDGMKLSVVFMNLLSNAVRFSSPGGRITLEVEENRENVFVCVRDQGLGIASDQLEKIFDEFYQVEDYLTRSSGGIGLGLSIAREIVELHGGKIWAESEGLGEGSQFWVRIPRRTS
jgi:signal transduction histidine kinase